MLSKSGDRREMPASPDNDKKNYCYGSGALIISAHQQRYVQQVPQGLLVLTCEFFNFGLRPSRLISHDSSADGSAGVTKRDDGFSEQGQRDIFGNGLRLGTAPFRLKIYNTRTVGSASSHRASLRPATDTLCSFDAGR